MIKIYHKLYDDYLGDAGPHSLLMNNINKKTWSEMLSDGYKYTYVKVTPGHTYSLCHYGSVDEGYVYADLELSWSEEINKIAPSVIDTV